MKIIATILLVLIVSGCYVVPEPARAQHQYIYVNGQWIDRGYYVGPHYHYYRDYPGHHSGHRH